MNDLKGRSLRGGMVTVAAQGTQFAIRMCSTVVLARMLTPKDFGLIAMVTALTGFAILFRDLGLWNSPGFVDGCSLETQALTTCFLSYLLHGGEIFRPGVTAMRIVPPLS